MNKEELVDAMVQRMGRQLKSLLSSVCDGELPAAAIETVLRQKLFHFGAQAMGVLLEATDERLAADRAVHDRPTRTVVTLFGPVDISRSRCADGSYPLDRRLGLSGRQGWTAGVQEAVSLLSCEAAFETVSDLMARLLGLSISHERVRTVAEQAGERAVALQAEQPTGPGCDASGKTLVVATDGCQAPQRDGWREVKVATMYTNESRVKTAGGRGKVLSKSHLASLDASSSWGMQLRCASEGWGVSKAKRVVVMGDGAAWIWTMAEEHFPGAVEIVDYYHAMEHLWAVGEALWGNRDTTAVRGWVRRYGRYLKRGRVDLVLEAMRRGWRRQLASLSAEAADTVRRNVEYFQTNRHRMAYGRFRRMRLPIGTGAVEGGCKFVVQSRFKKPGARWTEPGLRKMLALKVVRLNGWWQDLWPNLRIAA